MLPHCTRILLWHLQGDFITLASLVLKQQEVTSPMSLQEHAVSLRSKHARLEQLIDDEQHRPLPDQTTLAKLKREKLRVKDELEQMQHSATDSVPAMGSQVAS